MSTSQDLLNAIKVDEMGYTYGEIQSICLANDFDSVTETIGWVLENDPLNKIVEKMTIADMFDIYARG